MAKRKKSAKPLPGVTLEKAVAHIQQLMDRNSTVTHNEKLVDRVGNRRQFDVVIRGHFAGMDILGVVECKDHNTKKGPREVGAFAKECEHLNANIKLMVSKKGFTQQALRLARHDGIGCLSLLPNDTHQCGFTVGEWWYGVISRWTDFTLLVTWADPAL